MRIKNYEKKRKDKLKELEMESKLKRKWMQRWNGKKGRKELME